ncbi:MAG: ATP-binding protein [Prevotellaceae bacterium]|jgi:ATP-dependent DNA helicase RecG|nr:ATP-binding protein [Prevotellaceae bacterium]
METNRIEYKEKLGDSLEKEAVAFLNANGGDIFIGITGKAGGITTGEAGGITSIAGGITKTQLSVLNLIKSDERISISKIAEKLKINRSAVQKHIEKLKGIGILQRNGATFGGKWVIKE